MVLPGDSQRPDGGGALLVRRQEPQQRQGGRSRVGAGLGPGGRSEQQRQFALEQPHHRVVEVQKIIRPPPLPRSAPCRDTRQEDRGRRARSSVFRNGSTCCRVMPLNMWQATGDGWEAQSWKANAWPGDSISTSSLNPERTGSWARLLSDYSWGLSSVSRTSFSIFFSLWFNGVHKVHLHRQHQQQGYSPHFTLVILVVRPVLGRRDVFGL